MLQNYNVITSELNRLLFILLKLLTITLLIYCIFQFVPKFTNAIKQDQVGFYAQAEPIRIIANSNTNKD